ncbi:MAG TPA: hypothetical protein VFF72_06670 [Caldimonas sp.]|jgi:hypothetical protein|nr:hypothetical protein [Caldimonas sp.]
MTAIKTNVPAQQRARAEEARRKAENEANKTTQKALLNDAALWERMADYEEKHPQPEEQHCQSDEQRPRSK